MKQEQYSRWLGIGMMLGLSLLAGCCGSMCDKKGDTVALWNGEDFEGWTFFLASEDVAPETVWSVQDGVIHCTGKPNGYMQTTDRYTNYQLHVEWRWAEEPTNSGVLLHAQKPDQIWPKSIECQLHHQNAGDFILIDHTGITCATKRIQSDEKPFMSSKKLATSSEKAPGEWNTYDITCANDTIRCLVNGVLQNEGTEATPSEGYICLQSEGSPIEFRNIWLKPL